VRYFTTPFNAQAAHNHSVCEKIGICSFHAAHPVQVTAQTAKREADASLTAFCLSLVPLALGLTHEKLMTTVTWMI
jgi:hypothetical protein